MSLLNGVLPYAPAPLAEDDPAPFGPLYDESLKLPYLGSPLLLPLFMMPPPAARSRCDYLAWLELPRGP